MSPVAKRGRHTSGLSMRSWRFLLRQPRTQGDGFRQALFACHPGESLDPVTLVQHKSIKSLGPGYRCATAFAGLQTRTPQAARSASAKDGASNSGMVSKIFRRDDE